MVVGLVAIDDESRPTFIFVSTMKHAKEILDAIDSLDKIYEFLLILYYLTSIFQRILPRIAGQAHIQL